jgi:hypothetical protein
LFSFLSDVLVIEERGLRNNRVKDQFSQIHLSTLFLDQTLGSFKTVISITERLKLMGKQNPI